MPFKFSSNWNLNKFSRKINFFTEMFWVWYPKSTMGISDLWDLDLSRMFRKASRTRSSPKFCTFSHHGQMERIRIRYVQFWFISWQFCTLDGIIKCGEFCDFIKCCESCACGFWWILWFCEFGDFFGIFLNFVMPFPRFRYFLWFLLIGIFFVIIMNFAILANFDTSVNFYDFC